MARPLSLHHINALEIDGLSFISMAAQAGATQISIFTHAPRLALPNQKAPVAFPVFEPAIEDEARARLEDYSVNAVSMEFFPIAEDVCVSSYQTAIATGCRLGARRAVTHIHDSNSARAVDTLGEFCDLAARMEVTVGLEFMGLTPGCNSLARAAWFVDQVGLENLGIGLDPLHFVRTGGCPEQIAALNSRYFAYAQLCDGHGRYLDDAYIADALERPLPGDGDFPLVEILQALPRATPLEIETPSERREKSPMATQNFLTTIMRRCRDYIDRIEPKR